MSLDYYGHSSFKETWQGMDVIYSCDKLEVTGRFNFGGCAEMLNIMKYYSLCAHRPEELPDPWFVFLDEVRFYERLSMMNYRNNFTVRFRDGVDETYSFYFAVGFNGANGFSETWKLEFNPNKILTHCTDWFREFLCKLKSCSKVGGLTNSVEVRSMDFAVDFPVERDCVLYDRGSRGHRMYCKSLLDRTDYYGEPRKHGAVVVYNKQLEANLKKALTRLEVTLTLFDYGSVCKYFEAFFVLKYGQMGMNGLPKLSQNDKVMLNLLNMHPECLGDLTYDKRKKYTPYLEDFKLPFKLGLKGFESVCVWTSWFRELNIGRIFGDG